MPEQPAFQKPFQVVEVPGYGEVEFPATMSDTEIAAAIQRNLPSSASPAQRAPSAPSVSPAPSVSRAPLAPLAPRTAKLAPRTPKLAPRTSKPDIVDSFPDALAGAIQESANEPSFFEKISKPLISPETISQAMYGVSPKQVLELRDALPTEEEARDAANKSQRGAESMSAFWDFLPTFGLETQAGRRAFIAGLGHDAAELASSFTNPISLALLASSAAAPALLGGLAAAGRGYGLFPFAARNAGKALQLAGTGVNLGYGVQGGNQMKEAVAREDLPLPDRVQMFLGGASNLLGAAPTIGRGLAQGRNFIQGRQPVEVQKAGMLSSLPRGRAAQDVGELVGKNIDFIRAEAKKAGIKPADLTGEGGYERFVKLLDNAAKNLEKEYRSVLEPYRSARVETLPIRDAILSVIREHPEWNQLHPEVVIDLVEQANRFTRPMTLEQLNRERTLMNSQLNDLYRQSELGQFVNVNKARAAVLGTKTARDALTDTLYGELDRLINLKNAQQAKLSAHRTGDTVFLSNSKPDLAQLKAREGQIMELRELAESGRKRLEYAQAEHRAEGPVGRARKGIQTGLAFDAVRPIAGRAFLAESPEHQVSRRLSRAFAPSAVPVPAFNLVTKGIGAQVPEIIPQPQSAESESPEQYRMVSDGDIRRSFDPFYGSIPEPIADVLNERSERAARTLALENKENPEKRRKAPGQKLRELRRRRERQERQEPPSR